MVDCRMKLVNPEGKQKTDVLLVGINSRYTHTNPAVYSLRSYAKKQGFDVLLTECNVNANSLDILRQIMSFGCRAIGFSCYIWNLRLVVSLTKLIKQVAPDMVIIWGGPEVSANGKQWLKDLWQIDYLVAGEGEAAFAALLGATNEEKISRVPNLMWRDEQGNIVENPAAPPMDLADLAFCYTDGELKGMGSRILYYESSRGCPFGCHFCVSAREKVRYRPLDLVKQDLIKLRDSGCKKIKFVDRTFNSDKKRAYHLVAFLLELYKPGLCFHLEIEPSCLDETFIQLLAQAPAGYIQAEAGVQTLYLPALEAIGRHNLWQKAEPNIAKLIAADNIHIHLDLIGGLPYEGLLDFKQSFQQLYQLSPHYLQLGFLKVLPGTVLEEEAEQYQLVYQQEPPYQVVSTPWLSYSDMLVLIDVEYGVDQYYNDGYFLNTLKLATGQWRQAGKLVFDFYRDLALFDKIEEGGKSLNQKALILYRFLCRYFPENEALWFHSVRLDFFCRKSLPPVFFEPAESRLLTQAYQEGLLRIAPELADIPKKRWHKKIMLFHLPIAVADKESGIYAAFLEESRGVWQQPPMVKLAESNATCGGFE